MAIAEQKAEPPNESTSLVWDALEALVVPVLAVITALIIGGVIIVGTDPNVYATFRAEGLGAGLFTIWETVSVAYIAMFSGALGSTRDISESLVTSTPYIFAGLAVAVGFRGGLFNIGVEGQLLAGVMLSVYIGANWPLPMVVHLPLALLAGVLMGAIWAGLAGYLKAATGAHEVINTIMMNYIVFLFSDWALNGFLCREGCASPVSPPVLPTAYLPQINDFTGGSGYRLHFGFVLALLAAFGVWWLLFKTTIGFEIRTVGANPNAARYGGINTTKVTVLTMAISGALAGLAGASELLGVNRVLAAGFSSGYGFDAIALALLGRSHPLGVVLAALLFGTLRSGATRMQLDANIPTDIISIVQALVIVFIAAPAIVRWIYRVKVKTDEGTGPIVRGWGA